MSHPVRSRSIVLCLLWFATISLAVSCMGGSSNQEPASAIAEPEVTATTAPTATAAPTEAAPTATPDEISPEARAYLEQALDIMEEHSLLRYEIDWQEVRIRAYRRAVGAEKPGDLYGVIRSALNELGDNHSQFIHPEGAARMTEAIPGAPMPGGQIVDGDIGYLFIPAMGSAGEDRERYVETAGNLIRRHDQAGVCGWIVDLRDNGGGNMWPMLAGLGPILGEGIAGYFIGPDGDRIPWSYADGASRMDGEIVAQGPGFELDNPDMPIAVLTSRRTASAGEAVVVAFRGREHTRSFGGATAGVPTANGVFPLPDGAWIVLTTAEMADRNGNSYNSPIKPDVETSMNRSAPLEDEPAVVAALEWLDSQPACN